ncbi:hypothetical protein RF11_11733 [Thelohanellus kitauei]|uniref:Uncharacterized protein n=1 Tax=Thelohanellus kitauei TaxID=669202 RepID=A0A0C2MQ44_THEKT|nr:hypothetical protein RF11_11733 [Thelohanellus kitauei]
MTKYCVVSFKRPALKYVSKDKDVIAASDTHISNTESSKIIFFNSAFNFLLTTHSVSISKNNLWLKLKMEKGFFSMSGSVISFLTACCVDRLAIIVSMSILKTFTNSLSIILAISSRLSNRVTYEANRS